MNERRCVTAAQRSSPVDNIIPKVNLSWDRHLCGERLCDSTLKQVVRIPLGRMRDKLRDFSDQPLLETALISALIRAIERLIGLVGLEVPVWLSARTG